jgi:homoserine O-succinyltransferase
MSEGQDANMILDPARRAVARPPDGPADIVAPLIPRQASGTLRVGLVNNMPDPALLRTEQQLRGLLEAAIPGPFRISLYALPAIPRSDWGHRHIASSYTPIRELWRHPPDVLIVTGNEPKQRNLRDEPYWTAFADLIDWTQAHSIPAMFSCLAAHCAVLHFDAVPREPLERKCFGVFDHELATDHGLTLGAGSRMWLPHSRWNQVTETALAAGGYEVLSRSDEAGVGFFTKGNWLFCQGHPEYDGANLLREYRRDIRRFLRHERSTYPDPPRHYFNLRDSRLIAAFRDQALGERCEAIMANFPPALGPGPTWDSWYLGSVRIIRNWLDSACAFRTDQNAAAMAMSAD